MLGTGLGREFPIPGICFQHGYDLTVPFCDGCKLPDTWLA